MSKEIIELLSKEIETFGEAKKALIVVGNILKKEGTEDEHLKKLYVGFEAKEKACASAMELLQPKQATQVIPQTPKTETK
jgi:hypothetical protein